MSRALLIVITALMLLFPSGRSTAHALDPGYLELRQLTPDTWQVFWRKPTVQGTPMPIDARLPETCSPARAEGDPRFDGRAFVSQWVAACSAPLAGQPLTIVGLEATRTDVLVRISRLEGSPITARLTPDAASFDVPVDLTPFGVFKSYGGLGIEHILGGLDHLLFVFALMVLIRSPRQLVGAITAFTVAHSITLALATLDVITVPGPPVEAVIALSIVLVAVEILRQRRGDHPATARWPWVVAFSFGLLHGLGFAGALREIGLPEGDIPLALLAFNLGVEAGQLIFVAMVLILYRMLTVLWPALARAVRTPRSPVTLTLGYAIGGMAVFWVGERIAGF